MALAEWQARGGQRRTLLAWPPAERLTGSALVVDTGYPAIRRVRHDAGEAGGTSDRDQTQRAPQNADRGQRSFAHSSRSAWMSRSGGTATRSLDDPVDGGPNRDCDSATRVAFWKLAARWMLRA
jgi:hypothetical protein